MKTTYIVTGACGHLGNTVSKKLAASGEDVRALVFTTESTAALNGVPVRQFVGDVCDRRSLEPLFDVADSDVIVIHTAGIVSIASKFQPDVYDVNVNGTANIIELCKQHGVKRLVYVSSVHAIPETPQGQSVVEISDFHPKDVYGCYAKTKSAATDLVLRSGLDVVVVQPSGIIGPQDYGRAHATQLVMDFVEKRLFAMVKGGYDFVDVRDVADGVIAAAKKGRSGECYILSGHYVQVNELLSMLHEISGVREIRRCIPLWLAKLTAPLSEIYYRLRKQPPLYTPYSLYTLGSNARFSYEKARKELAFSPRDLWQTLRDTVDWLIKQSRIRIVKSAT